MNQNWKTPLSQMRRSHIVEMKKFFLGFSDKVTSDALDNCKIMEYTENYEDDNSVDDKVTEIIPATITVKEIIPATTTNYYSLQPGPLCWVLGFSGFCFFWFSGFEFYGFSFFGFEFFMLQGLCQVHKNSGILIFLVSLLFLLFLVFGGFLLFKKLLLFLGFVLFLGYMLFLDFIYFWVRKRAREEIWIYLDNLMTNR